MRKLIHCIKEKKGSSFPLTIAVTLALLLILCGILEYFRLNIIAGGVREAVQDAIISTVNDNYANVYHGVREGYSGGYQPDDSSFSYSVDLGDVYGHLDNTLGTGIESGRHVKYSGDVVEYTLSGLEVTVRNAPFAPSSSQNAQRFEADAMIILEVPVQFAGKWLPPMRIKLKVQAGYTSVF